MIDVSLTGYKLENWSKSCKRHSKCFLAIYQIVDKEKRFFDYKWNRVNINYFEEKPVSNFLEWTFIIGGVSVNLVTSIMLTIIPSGK